ncbi:MULTISPECIES: ParB/RepB/Spo0J family partition protein [Agrobacterium]|uniref:ParB/RepB/Spo0J family partition protein n=1 Tax=Agrobacterium leguminum TaxID=2792015 RepID=A0A9X3HLP4_9HYPH|nr:MULTISPECIES: ParB/RepB/Spo0J family partition protein [Agrobacterium]MCZ7908334.1 ParB/RepB/Spo0J family partition protein [Agrobacterium leguminum]MDH0612816.1 ParB/RepB/Spo0J family partition protein [Agrobacterium sp. GD03872]MDH0694680.1 ParB/RepB/Spo0J family partition protein [Agrobacterium sp. GD03871]MDH1057922.1 ParB/RepB/Spo0J family partition protein [Agrobacterium sp. GD03992]MDH2209211.1 ParB/RepB/Spo0J family partition protein [Agrobacterium sp. GD03643]
MGDITRSDDFKFRFGKLDRHHKADLAGHLRRTGKPLDPVLLWRDMTADEVDVVPLILLDGEHRIAAYKAVGDQGRVPAIILHCDRRTALLAALGGNAKYVLSLSQMERTDAAWRLVREPVEPSYTRKEIVGMASVSARTVNYMRSRWAEMVKAGQEPTGEWGRDRSDKTTERDGDEMTDARREREIALLVTEIRDVIDRRKRPEKAILRDGQAVDTAIIEALGDKRFKELADYFFGEDEQRDEWLGDTLTDDADCSDNNEVEDANF